MGRPRNDRRKKLGAHLKSLREAMELSQAEVARRAGNDLSQTDISKIEQGKRWPSVPQLAALFRVLNVDSSVLAQLTENPS